MVTGGFSTFNCRRKRVQVLGNSSRSNRLTESVIRVRLQALRSGGRHLSRPSLGSTARHTTSLVRILGLVASTLVRYHYHLLGPRSIVYYSSYPNRGSLRAGVKTSLSSGLYTLGRSVQIVTVDDPRKLLAYPYHRPRRIRTTSIS